MGFYSTEPAFSRGVGNGKRAVRFFPADHRRKSPSRPAKARAKQGFSAVVSRTSAPGVPLYGYRYYSPELGRWVSRDPIEELGFQSIASYVSTDNETLIKEIREILATFLLSDPAIADVLRQVIFLLEVEISKVGIDPHYGFIHNDTINRIDLFGLEWWWPPSWGKDKDKDKCCDEKATEAALNHAKEKLIQAAKKFPGKAGEIAKIIAIIDKAIATGKFCATMDSNFKVCEDFANDPGNPALCYGCCMLLQPNKGAGHFVCTSICGQMSY